MEQGGSVCSWGETSAWPRCPCPRGPHPGVTLSFPPRADCSISTAFSCAADTSGEGNATRAALASFVSEGKWLSCAGDAVAPPCPPPMSNTNLTDAGIKHTAREAECSFPLPAGGAAQGGVPPHAQPWGIKSLNAIGELLTKVKKSKLGCVVSEPFFLPGRQDPATSGAEILLAIGMRGRE